jgi:beta-lactamase regulating signal transducer with metallopeptidase domain
MNILPSLFHWILDAGFRASLLSIAILFLQAALRPVISARARYLLWLPVLVVLTVPILPRSRWSAENLFASSSHAPAPVVTPAIAPEVEDALPTSQVVSVASTDWKSAAAIVWAAGAALSFAAGLALYCATLRRYMQVAEDADDSLTGIIASLSAELRLRRPPRVILSGAIESPAVTGLLRPLLLLPADFGTAFTGNEARLVLKHELMHLKRFDLEINALVFALNALHWFNPVLWLATWRARQDREAACDAQVLASEPSDCRGDYGYVLLKAEAARHTPWLSLGFAGIFEPGRALRSRIKGIVRYRSPGPLSTILAGATILLLAVLGCQPRADKQPAPAATPGATATPRLITYDARNTDDIRNKLNNLIIPSVNFHDATLREAVDFLKTKSIELDTAEPDPTQRGVNIVLQFDSTVDTPRITLSLNNVPLIEALKYVCQLTNGKLKIDPYAVSIVPLSLDTDEFITKAYDLSSSFASQIAPGQTAMDFLTARGVKFPPGAAAAYFPSSGRLIVHDTSSNIELVDAIAEKFIGPPAASPSP